MITWNKCKKITKEQRLAQRGLAFSPSAHATPEGFKRSTNWYTAPPVYGHTGTGASFVNKTRGKKNQFNGWTWYDLHVSFVKMSSLRSLQLSPRIFTLRRQHTELSSTHLRHRQTHCSKSAESAESQVTWWRIRGILRMRLSLSNEILSNCYDTTYSHRGKRVYIYIYGKWLSLIVIAGYWRNHLARSNPITISDLASFTEKGRGFAPLFALPHQTKPVDQSDPSQSECQRSVCPTCNKKKQSSSLGYCGKRFKNSPKCFGGVLVGKTSFLSWKNTFFSGKVKVGLFKFALICSALFIVHLFGHGT